MKTVRRTILRGGGAGGKFISKNYSYRHTTTNINKIYFVFKNHQILRKNNN